VDWQSGDRTGKNRIEIRHTPHSGTLNPWRLLILHAEIQRARRSDHYYSRLLDNGERDPRYREDRAVACAKSGADPTLILRANFGFILPKRPLLNL